MEETNIDDEVRELFVEDQRMATLLRQRGYVVVTSEELLAAIKISYLLGKEEFLKKFKDIK